MSEWDRTTVYISNGGDGPLRANILCVTKGVATMEQWNEKSPKRRKRFELPLKNLLDGKTGWRPQ